MNWAMALIAAMFVKIDPRSLHLLRESFINMYVVDVAVKAIDKSLKKIQGFSP